MLRQCRTHGNFIGTNCPECNAEGKFIMADREMNSIGRILALVLRHAPEKFGVDMDLNGWVNAKDLAFAIQNKRRNFHWLRSWHFQAISETDTKGRYQVEGDMIRATYAHSIELELDLPTDEIPDELYWPCNPETLQTHMEFGLTSGDRKHVHLSRTIGNAMEAGHVHHSRPAILEIDAVRAIAEGHTIWRAGKTVFLCEEMPPDFLYKVDDDDPIIQEIIAQWEEE